MQTLKRRNTYTPLGVPQAQCNCGLLLNSVQGVECSAISLKTLFNSPMRLIPALGQSKSFILGGYLC